MDTLKQKLHEADEAVEQALSAIEVACKFSDEATRHPLFDAHALLERAGRKLKRAWALTEATHG